MKSFKKKITNQVNLCDTPSSIEQQKRMHLPVELFFSVAVYKLPYSLSCGAVTFLIRIGTWITIPEVKTVIRIVK